LRTRPNLRFVIIRGLSLRGDEWLDEPGGDELAERGLGYPNMASDSRQTNAALGDQPAREPLGGSEQLGGFCHGKQAV
jgi:hypothetical protein